MKRYSLWLPLFALLTNLALFPAQAQVTAAPAKMTFQGRLAKPDGTPVADGSYAVRFSLHDALAGGNEKWSQTLANVAVRNGTFAALLDVNTANLFAGDLYLEIKIGNDAPLTPRQSLVSVPYALKANTVPDGSITADKLATDALNNLSWLLGGNSGTNPASHFLGTADSQPLVVRTNNVERLRIDSSGNVGIGNNTPGFPLSFANTLGDKISLWGGPGASYGFGIQGGQLQIHGNHPASDITFGYGSSAAMTEVMRIKGSGHVGIGTNDPQAKLHVNGTAAITGSNMLEFGQGVAGKQGDAGKIGYQAYSDALDIIGAGTEGGNRKIKFWNEGGATFTGGATFNGTAQMTGFQMPTGAGANKVLVSDASGNGAWGNVSVAWSQIANIPGGLGGANNTASGNYATVTGGQFNTASGLFSFVGGGEHGSASGMWATLGGGHYNSAPGIQSTVAGGDRNTAGGDAAAIAGGTLNNAGGVYSAVAGGLNNRASMHYSTIGGGRANVIDVTQSLEGYITIGGGYENTAGGLFGGYATVSGGQLNVANGRHATVAGGGLNRATGEKVIVAGGSNNTASGLNASVMGGDQNTASNGFALAAGGYRNTAGGVNSFAAGRFARANHDLTFVWNDGSSGDFASTGNFQFLIRAASGVGINTNNPAGYALNVNGTAKFSGEITVNTTTYTSDARYKRNIVSFDNALDTILNLRGVTYAWDKDAWKDRNFPDGKQIGFIAQEVEKVLPELVTTDANGYKSVAYANVVPVLVEAVKTLKKENDTKAKRLADVEAKNAELEARLERLEAALRNQK